MNIIIKSIMNLKAEKKLIVNKTTVSKKHNHEFKNGTLVP